MIRQVIMFAALVAVLNGAASYAVAQESDDQGERVDHPVDSPLYTLRGPESPSIALIQTAEEVEYIGDYLELDIKRAGSALRMLRHVDFEQNMLLVVNGGRVEGAMLRVESVYDLDGELHVVVVTDDPPSQYGDSGFASPASDTFTPAVVTVLPRFQGRVVVHAFPAVWGASGDLRGVEIIVVSQSDQDEGAAGDEGEINR